jgi:nicotinamide mononucleotide adenylyltransferase
MIIKRNNTENKNLWHDENGHAYVQNEDGTKTYYLTIFTSCKASAEIQRKRTRGEEYWKLFMTYVNIGITVIKAIKNIYALLVSCF